MNETVKHGIDFAAAGTVVATIAGWLPPLAAAFAIAWYVIQMRDRWKYGPKGKE